MKSPLDKLRRFAMNKRDSKDKRYFQPSAQLDELAQAAKVSSPCVFYLIFLFLEYYSYFCVMVSLWILNIH